METATNGADGSQKSHALEAGSNVPRRGEEIEPGWIVDEVEIRDGRADDLFVEGTPTYVEARMVSAEDFVA